MDHLEQLIADATEAFEKTNNLAELEQIKSQFLGKSGKVTELLKGLAKLPMEERKQAGATINRCKQAIEGALESQKVRLQEQKLQAQLAADALDVTLPGRGLNAGSIHPISRAQQRIEAILSSAGFVVADGPEIESDWYNFTALNMPDNHPARSMHDTFYLQDRKDVLLRTHTSPVQIRAMRHHVECYQQQESMPDLRLVAPGRTYRVDSDATHSPMFNQVEGLWVGGAVSMSHLKGIIEFLLKHFFETEDLILRLRPSFFPFTEPSAEIDMAFTHGKMKGKWLEIAGCGMVHPNVLHSAGVDTKKYTGFAFGMGLDRLAMLRYGINDLRLFYENDLRFLTQFR